MSEISVVVRKPFSIFEILRFYRRQLPWKLAKFLSTHTFIWNDLTVSWFRRRKTALESPPSIQIRCDLFCENLLVLEIWTPFKNALIKSSKKFTPAQYSCLASFSLAGCHCCCLLIGITITITIIIISFQSIFTQRVYVYKILHYYMSLWGPFYLNTYEISLLLLLYCNKGRERARERENEKRFISTHVQYSHGMSNRYYRLLRSLA